MQIETAQSALSRARRDYEHAVSAGMAAETTRSRQRHFRRAQVASRRIRDALRDVARLSSDGAALAEYRLQTRLAAR
jgi:hypothetical protein